MKFSAKETAAYGFAAIGKDMVYALSASYVMYYYQDLLGLSATFVGTILMIARIFDAANDPFMGVLVAKTNSRWGRFRPWLFSGTVLNAFVLFALFNAKSFQGTGLMVYFSVIYILWGMTYTMMDIPYWSMIPAVTDTAPEREKLSVVGRTCAGVGNALITVGTVMLVKILGSGNEVAGFGRFALIVSIIFIVAEVIMDIIHGIVNDLVHIFCKLLRLLYTFVLADLFNDIVHYAGGLIDNDIHVILNFLLEFRVGRGFFGGTHSEADAENKR